MNRNAVAHYVGQLFLILAFFMAFPVLLAIIDGQPRSIFAYGVSVAATLLVGIGCRYFSLETGKLRIVRQDAFGIVAFGWLGSGLLAALPFFIEGSIGSYPSAVFEAVSGLTTTGGTVIANVEVLSRATHLWRVLLHWIGGMGIVVLFVAIFPQLGLGGKHLFRSEVSGPINEGIKPRIKQTALRLWWIYVALTALCTVLLFISGLSLFESFCHALSSLSTGGFSTRNASIGAFDNGPAEWIIIVSMFVGGLDFALYYRFFRGKFDVLFANIEVRVFFYLNLFVSFFIFFSTTGISGHDWLTEYRSALFQTVAVTSTTGLMTADFDTYPVTCKFLLFLAMFIGGCAGSTAGGLKVSRVVVIFKRSVQELRLFLHPAEVVSTKMGKQTVRSSIISSILIFAAVYLLIYSIGVFLMLLLGMDFLTAASSVIACLSSVGPGFASVGPTQNYEFVHPLGKFILSFLMIAGRLEVFVLLSIFTPSFWRRG